MLNTCLWQYMIMAPACAHDQSTRNICITSFPCIVYCSVWFLCLHSCYLLFIHFGGWFLTILTKSPNCFLTGAFSFSWQVHQCGVAWPLHDAARLTGHLPTIGKGGDYAIVKKRVLLSFCSMRRARIFLFVFKQIYVNFLSFIICCRYGNLVQECEVALNLAILRRWLQKYWLLERSHLICEAIGSS